MVKTRYQIIADVNSGQRVFTDYRDVIKSIWEEEGIKHLYLMCTIAEFSNHVIGFRGFYKGMTASYVGCLEGAVQWITYEKLKTLKLPFRRDFDEIDPSSYFFMAGFSKFIAVCLTYPHEVVRTRLREQATNGMFKYSGFFNALLSIGRIEGRR